MKQVISKYIHSHRGADLDSHPNLCESCSARVSDDARRGWIRALPTESALTNTQQCWEQTESKGFPLRGVGGRPTCEGITLSVTQHVEVSSGF